MKTIEYTNVQDRTKWGSGPWDDEPMDKMQWRDLVTGLPCLMVRGPVGAWCGYVGIEDPDHQWYEKDYSDDDGNYIDVNVHGGLTFASFCQEGETPDGERICHIVEDGETDRAWWLGFDTGHAYDKVPAYPMIVEGTTYRTQEYVRGEVLTLAQQVQAAA